MKLIKLIAAVIAAALPQRSSTVHHGVQTRDVAFTYRMGAGFAGDVNRTHPAEIEPVLIDEDDPITRYGNIGVIDTVTAGLRGIVAADASDGVDLTPWGALVRPYPAQQSSASNYGEASLGAATPPDAGVADVLRSGLIMVQLNANVAAPVKGGRVFIWAAATAGDHVQGGYETAISAGNTVELDQRYKYNGAPDSTGVVELSCNV